MTESPRPTTAYVVVACHVDGSGVLDDVYGPYGESRAKEIASALTSGDWQMRPWEVRPLKLTPWEPTQFSVSGAIGGAIRPLGPGNILNCATAAQ